MRDSTLKLDARSTKKVRFIEWFCLCVSPLHSFFLRYFCLSSCIIQARILFFIDKKVYTRASDCIRKNILKITIILSLKIFIFYSSLSRRIRIFMFLYKILIYSFQMINSYIYVIIIDIIKLY